MEAREEIPQIRVNLMQCMYDSFRSLSSIVFIIIFYFFIIIYSFFAPAEKVSKMWSNGHRCLFKLWVTHARTDSQTVTRRDRQAGRQTSRQTEYAQAARNADMQANTLIHTEKQTARQTHTHTVSLMINFNPASSDSVNRSTRHEVVSVCCIHHVNDQLLAWGDVRVCHVRCCFWQESNPRPQTRQGVVVRASG